ncbi:MAG: hypothetical protein NW241_04170 [Bacteroidia bacterium]|nr:hypothetical protein [Bacteroidia bacterium]
MNPLLRTPLLLAALLAARLAPAQAFFEGTLLFEVRMEGPQAALIQENEPNTGMTMHLRGGDYIVNLTGGRYPKTFLFIADSNYEYSVDAQNRAAYRYSAYGDITREAEPIPVKAQPTGKTDSVAGVLCKEYLVKTGDATFLYYVSDQYRADLSRFPDSPRTKAGFLAPGLEGRIPLKTIKRQPGLTVTTTVKKITPATFKPEQFRVPSSFTVKKRDYRY